MAASARSISVVGILAVFGIDADADARRQADQHVIADAAGRRQCRDQLLGDRGRVGRLRHFGEQDQELVAAVAADRVGFAHRRRQALRGQLEHLVADRVAERVVDLLEVVEVQEQQRDGVPRRLRAWRWPARTGRAAASRFGSSVSASSSADRDTSLSARGGSVLGIASGRAAPTAPAARWPREAGPPGCALEAGSRAATTSSLQPRQLRTRSLDLLAATAASSRAAFAARLSSGRATVQGSA